MTIGLRHETRAQHTKEEFQGTQQKWSKNLIVKMILKNDSNRSHALTSVSRHILHVCLKY